MKFEWIQALWGGVLIGTSVSLMMLWNGRVTGISGIAYGVLTKVRGDRSWRVSFLLGLLAGGLTLFFANPTIFANTLSTELWTVALAGGLVGFGTVLGNGCTSGHSICGISRMSPRSIIATVLFIFAGMSSVYYFKNIGVLP